MTRRLDEFTPSPDDAGGAPRSAGRVGAPDSSAVSPPVKRRSHRRLRMLVLSLFIGLVISGAAAPTILKSVIRRQLTAIVAENLIGELKIGTISFTLPWTVSVSDSSFIARGPTGELYEMIRVPRLSLTLSKSPLAKGPVAVEDAKLEDPTIHLIQTEHGIIGVRPDPPPSSPKKFSEIAILRRFGLTRGHFVLEDRTEPAAVPTEWRKVEVALDHGLGPAEYAYRLGAEGASHAGLDSSGKIDLDSLILHVESCTASIMVGAPARESALPAVAQHALSHVGAVGELNIRASGIVPMLKAEMTTYQGAITISNGTLDISEWQTRFDHLNTQFTVDAASDATKLNVKFAALDTNVGDALVHLEDVPGNLDFDAETWNARIGNARVVTGSSRQGISPDARDLLAAWNVHGNIEFGLTASGPLTSGDLKLFHGDLRIKPGNYSFQSPDMKTPLDRFAAATVNLEGGNLLVKQLRAMCGEDTIFLKEATLALGELPAKFSVKQASGAVTFGANHGSYPPAVAEYIDRYNPVGPFFFSGELSTDSSSGAMQSNYDFEVRTLRGRFDLIDRRIPVYNVRGLVQITPGAITIKNLDADAIGGRLAGTGKIDMGKIPSYSLQLNAVGLDLRELATRMATPGHAPRPVSGRAKLDVLCTGIIPENGLVLDHLRGDGKFDIRNGGFFEVPVLKAIAEAAGAKSAAVVSDAGAKFRVADRKMIFDRALIAAPALGVEGTGTVDFDGNVDFHKVSALAGGDWQRNAGEATPAGQVLGKIQNTLNGVTRSVWYDLDVTGTVQQPVVKAIPAPFLSKPALHVKELITD